jgi:hypothetical protein
MSTSFDDSEEKNTEEQKMEEYESLKSSKFKQQRLPAWRPVPTIVSSTITYFLFGGIFIVIGVFISSLSKQIEEIKIRYDNKTHSGTAIVTFKPSKTIKPPIMVYYEIDGFYQNHRRYVKSKDDEQLSGKDLTLDEIKKNGNCKPVETNKEMGVIKSINKINYLEAEDVAIPCGLLARSYFQDYFDLFDENEDPIKINQENIIYGADRKKFKNIDENRQWANMTDEHFIVWMRPSGLPNFRKLWGRIEQNLEKDVEYTMQIESTFNVKKFNGKKYVILSNANILGGKNDGLALSYIIIGAISIVIGIIFLVWYLIKKNNEEKESED